MHSLNKPTVNSTHFRVLCRIFRTSTFCWDIPASKNPASLSKTLSTYAGLTLKGLEMDLLPDCLSLGFVKTLSSHPPARRAPRATRPPSGCRDYTSRTFRAPRLPFIKMRWRHRAPRVRKYGNVTTPWPALRPRRRRSSWCLPGRAQRRAGWVESDRGWMPWLPDGCAGACRTAGEDVVNVKSQVDEEGSWVLWV